MEDQSAVLLWFMMQLLEDYEPGLVDIIKCIVETITIDDVGEIPDEKYRDNLTLIGHLVIPNSVTTIGEAAFYICRGLTSVEIPNSVTTIGKGVFYECTSLTSVEIQNSVTIIGWYAFCGCRRLTSIEIPNSVTWIGFCAFPETCIINRI